ncbi:GlcNAc-binding protein A [Streptomyces sp. RB5]|uniref:GlcNAc-binding protein A n=1 Tax=Streptomyces smaragdinus TaxID=2585196 RepID=A0A7K0CEL5_9ACTN|nr:lytic polysaccharide monooxygenase [Streptomyces smaragdinus]MQY11793.1 GlcNAc-binding protein A [Streptomyces smaragdinus]
MNSKRRLAALVGTAVAPVLAVTIPAGTAEAHGYVTGPASRQAQCAAGTVSCGQIKYEPQSVEGPKGLKSCSAGHAEYAELDDDSKGWKVTGVGSSTTFTWKNTARHSTSNWQYFIGGTKIAEVAGNNQQPAETVSHTVNFNGFTGKQKVLAVWNISDTANAFYSCIDVNIGGGDSGGTPGTPGGGTPGTSCAVAWDAATAYTGGSQVTYGGHTWRAKWWTQGEQPGSTGQWGVWEDLGACA